MRAREPGGSRVGLSPTPPYFSANGAGVHWVTPMKVAPADWPLDLEYAARRR